MRSGIKITAIILLVSIIIIAALFFYPLKGGKPLLSTEQFGLPPLPDVTLPGLPHMMKNDDSDGTVTVYRWKDSDGSWHFSNEPPPSGVEYQTGAIDPNANIIQSDGGTAPSTTVKKRTEGTKGGEKHFGYTTDDLSRMLQSADRAREASEQRQQKQQSAIEAE